MSQIIGHISQVIGPVVDVYFEGTDAELIPFSKRFRIGNDTLSGIFHTQPVCPSLPAVEPER